MAALTLNHRRDRQQTRRYLAEIRVRGRDLTGPFFHTEFDHLDGQPQMRDFPQHSAFARNLR